MSRVKHYGKNNQIRSLLTRIVLGSLCGVFLASTLRCQARPEKDSAISAEERRTVIEESLKKLNDYYVYPETAREMEKAVRARLERGEYAAITSGVQLSEKLTADLREVSRDNHLRILFFPDGAPDFAGSTNLKSERQEMARTNYGFGKVARLKGNVGYVELLGFVDTSVVEATEKATAVMSSLADSDALIVDLRRNGGGHPSMIAYILSYLLDQPTHLNDIHDRTTGKSHQWWTRRDVPGRKFGGDKPVMVLISASTFSGGEEFAYNLRNLERAILIGETTGGGAHPSRPFRVSERFGVSVPFARAISPITGTNWEGTGVAPHIAVSADQAMDAAYTLTLEKMAQRTSDVRRRAELQQLLKER